MMLWNERRTTGMDFAGYEQHQQRRTTGEVDVFSSADMFQSANDLNLWSNIGNNEDMTMNNAVISSRSRSTSGDNSSTGSVSSSSSSSPKSDRYKTELCRTFSENGSCRYGDKCQFAHGVADLRTVMRHPKYKTDLCRTFHSTGFCPYGTRCHFVHAMNEGGKAAAGGAGGSELRRPSEAQPVSATPAFVRPDSLFGGLGATASAMKLRPTTASDVFASSVGPDLNMNILAHLLQSMDVNNCVKSQTPHPPNFSTSFHPLSPTHSLDSTAYSSSSSHSLSPCPSPTDDLLFFAAPSTSAAIHNRPSHHHFPLTPQSVVSPTSGADPSTIWPTTFLPSIPLPNDCLTTNTFRSNSPFSSSTLGSSSLLSSNHYVFA